MPKTMDEMQSDVTELIKDNLRGLLGQDHYEGRIQAVVITTNTITGKINVDSCNAPLAQDQRKIIYEALRTIDNARLMVAIDHIVKSNMPKIKYKGGKS